MKRIFLVAAFLLTLTRVAAGAVPPDGWRPTFAGGNFKTIGVQPWDGKVLVAGSMNTDPMTMRSVVRINVDGTLDTSFDVSTDNPVWGAIPLPGRTCLIFGEFTSLTYRKGDGTYATVPRTGIARLDENGVPDSLTLTGDLYGMLTTAALLPDGKSVVLGGAFIQLSGVSGDSLTRISLDPATYGEIDTSFPQVGYDEWVKTVLVQDDGRIVVGGDFSEVTAGGVTVPRTNLFRLNPDFTLDESFDVSLFSTDPHQSDSVSALVQEPDGDLVVGGSFTDVTPHGGGAIPRHNLVRLTRFGAIDPTFDPSPDRGLQAMALQPDGKLVVGGSFGTIAGQARTQAARLNPDGSADDFAPVLQSPWTGAFVQSLAVQPDGKIILAISNAIIADPVRRYYPYGTCDSDTSTAALPDALMFPLALQPDGMLTLGGVFTSVGGTQGYPNWPEAMMTYTGTTQRLRVARLKPDWTLADAGQFDPGLSFGPTYAFALKPDLKMWTGGYFWLEDCPLTPGECLDSWIHSDTRVPHLETIDQTGHYDPALDPAGKTVYQNVQDLMLHRAGAVYAITPVPQGYPYAGMAYVGGEFRYDTDHLNDPAPAEYYLFRIKENGERDPSFDTGDLLDGRFGLTTGTNKLGKVTAVAIQPDGKVLAALSGVSYPTAIITHGVILRFLPTGELDPTFIPFYIDRAVYAMGLQRDGRIILAGLFDYPVQKDGTIFDSNILRLYNGTPGHADGTLDDSLVLEGSIGNWMFDPFIYNFALQSDGSMMIVGVFDHLKDRLGTVARDYVAKIAPDGTVDRSYDLGPIYYYTVLDKVDTAILQPDGKVIIAGGFEGIGGPGPLYARHNLARFANNVGAVQHFDISPDGSTISWLRDGAAPEVWGVSFEDSPDGTSWSVLGKGTPIAGGWGMTVTDPIPKQQNRYLRARAYAVNSSRDSVLLEEKRSYYLKPVLTVRAKSTSREYGSANPALEAEYQGLLDGDTAATVLTGTPVLSTAAAAASPVGDYPITASLGALASWKYTLVAADGVLTVTKAPLTVSAAAASRVYGDPDPAPAWTPTGLKNGDAIGAVTYTSSGSAWSPVGSALTLTPGGAVFSAGSAGNYDITYLPGALGITPRTLTVRADDQYKSAGHDNPPLTVSYAGFAPGESASVLSGAPSLSTAVNLSTPAGDYPISIAQNTLSSDNYTFVLVGGTFHVANPMAQSIAFPLLKAHTYGDGDFLPGATATSGLAVSYASQSEGVARIVTDGAGQERVRVTGPGSSDITASQGGNWQYLAADSVTRALLVNPPPWNGVGLDGVDDVLRVPNAPQLDVGAGDNLTLEAWLRLDASQPDGAAILSKGGGGGAGYALVVYQDRLGGELSDGVASLDPAGGFVGATTLNDGLWHQAALTVDRQSGTARLYLDGRLEKETALPAALGSLVSGADLLAGVDGSGTRHFQGALDELRVWKRARSRDELRSAASAIIDPADYPDLAAYFHLDEGDAGGANAGVTVAPERTAFADDGTLSGLALSGATSNWVPSGAFAPLLKTSPIASLPLEGAVAGGEIYPNYYPPTDRGLCWGSAPNPGLADSCTHLGGGATGSFVSTIGGLTPGATYHLRAFAVNGQGTSYGNDVSFQATKRDQTTTFTPLPVKTYGDPDFSAGGTSDSGLPVTYQSSQTDVATVTGDTIHITGAGTTVITATQEGDGTYKKAEDVPQILTVNPAHLTVKADDKTRPYKSPDPPFTVGYSGFVNGEGMSVLSGTPLAGTTALWESNVGTYPITVQKNTLSAHNYTFDFAAGTLSITRSGQCITFPQIGERTYGENFTVTAAACSGRSVSFESSDTSIIRVDGNTLVIVGTGTVTITARESGGGNFDPADAVTQTVTVQKAGQRLDFSSLAQKVVGDAPFQLAGSATSGLAVRYESSDTAVATVAGSTVTIVGAGAAVITALQDGNQNYTAAAPVLQTLTVAQEGVPPLLTVSTLSSGATTASPVLNIQGVCSDPSGIAGVTVNGVDVAGDPTRFSVPLVLTSGTNSVTVSAVDGAGNRTTESRTVLLSGSGPVLALSAPPDNVVTADPQVPVRGTAGEGSAVTVSVNGSAPRGLALTAGAFSATATLSEGVNTIEVNAASAGVSTAVKRSVVLSTGKPAVAIDSPVQDAMTEATAATMTGTATGDGPIQVTVSVNGATFTPTLTAGAFRQEIPLGATGTYRIAATATSAAGSSIAYRNIVRTEVIAGDLDRDGAVDVRDALQALSVSLGLQPATTEVLAHADVAPLVDGVPHPDGVVDIGDVVVILRKAVGLVDF